MKPTGSMTTRGFRELEASLSDLGKATKKNVARRALRVGGEPIRAAWERLAPIDQGDLKRSIKIGNAIGAFNRAGNRGQVVSQFIGIDESINRRLHIYAEVIEFGSESRPAHPAGRPAFESQKEAAVIAIGGALKVEIEKAAKRAARKAARL